MAEKEETEESKSWWDKTLLVALGLGAYYIYKKVK